jgi:hypothetical protein
MTSDKFDADVMIQDALATPYLSMKFAHDAAVPTATTFGLPPGMFTILWNTQSAFVNGISGYGEWNVTIRSVPEPGAFVWLASTFVVLRRRR